MLSELLLKYNNLCSQYWPGNNKWRLDFGVLWDWKEQVIHLEASRQSG